MIGVVPMEHIDIDDEDSLSERLEQTGIGQGLDVAVIAFPTFQTLQIFPCLSG